MPSGVLSFVRRPEVQVEKNFYDDVYGQRGKARIKRPISASVDEWSAPWHPQNAQVLTKVLPLQNQKILILGNGVSAKEMHFLEHSPALYIYSDLSPDAVAFMRDSFAWEQCDSQVHFAAIDAQELPIEDGTIDILYCYAMVHHLPDVQAFLTEVVRVLTPGGRAIFLDDAYSPLWHWFKSTIGRPLMLYSHSATGISPEDLRFSLSGGFREANLAALIRDAGARPYFERASFLNYLWHRAVEKLLPGSMRRFLLAARIGRLLSLVDSTLAKIPFGRKLLIRLVWGLQKP